MATKKSRILTDADVLQMREHIASQKLLLAADTLHHGKNASQRRKLETNCRDEFFVYLNGQIAKTSNLCLSPEEEKLITQVYPDGLPEVFESLESAVSVYNLLG
jgi:hypothetical protein